MMNSLLFSTEAKAVCPLAPEQKEPAAHTLGSDERTYTPVCIPAAPAGPCWRNFSFSIDQIKLQCGPVEAARKIQASLVAF